MRDMLPVLEDLPIDGVLDRPAAVAGLYVVEGWAELGGGSVMGMDTDVGIELCEDTDGLAICRMSVAEAATAGVCVGLCSGLASATVDSGCLPPPPKPKALVLAGSPLGAGRV